MEGVGGDGRDGLIQHGLSARSVLSAERSPAGSGADSRQGTESGDRHPTQVDHPKDDDRIVPPVVLCIEA